MKKPKTILCIAAILVFAAAAFLGFWLYRHEKAQNDDLRELQSRQSAVLAAEEELSARLTLLEIKSDYAEASYKYFPLGNSITVHAPNEVWWNEVGMAASDADHDYVHLVAAYISASHGKTACHPYYFYAWETAEDRSSKLSFLDPFLDPGLDLVTIQLGENVEDLSTFEQDFEELIRYVQAKAPGAKILVIDDFWPNGERSRMKQNAVERTGAEFISLKDIQGSADVEAGVGAVVYDPAGNPHTVENADVAAHPGDRGMQAIADRIIEALQADEVNR